MNDNWKSAFQGIKQICSGDGIKPFVFCEQLLACYKVAMATYPDNKKKALEMTGIALYKEFRKDVNGL